MLTEEEYLSWGNTDIVCKVMYWARYKYDTAGNMILKIVDQIINGQLKSFCDEIWYTRGYQLYGILREALGYDITIMFEYDANGNLTHIEPQAQFPDEFYNITEMDFQYDLKNRMTEYRFGGTGDWNEIRYDALGRVRERVDLTPTTTKYYSDGRQLIQQLDNSNNVQFDYLRGPTGLDRQWNEGNDTRRFYIKDNLGTVWAIVNPSDLSVKRYNYNAWGEHLDSSDINFPDYNSDPNLMRYIGCRFEAFSTDWGFQNFGLYHMDHRHYLPFLGRFLQREPLGLVGEQIWIEAKDKGALSSYGDSIEQLFFHSAAVSAEFISETHEGIALMPYQYSDNQPSNRFDPSGLLCCERIGSSVTETFILWRVSRNPVRFCVWKCWFYNMNIRKKYTGGCWGLETKDDGYDSYVRQLEPLSWLSQYYPGLQIYRLTGWGKPVKEYFYASYGWRNITIKRVGCHFEHNIFPDYKFAPPDYCTGEYQPGRGVWATFEVSNNKSCDAS